MDRENDFILKSLNGQVSVFEEHSKQLVNQLRSLLNLNRAECERNAAKAALVDKMEHILVCIRVSPQFKKCLESDVISCSMIRQDLEEVLQEIKKIDHQFDKEMKNG